MAFFQSSISALQTLVVAIGAGLGLWGGINLIKGYETDLHTAVRHQVPEEGFCGMDIKGRTFAEKKDAGEMLLAVCKQYQGDRSEPIGTYRGLQMELSLMHLTARTSSR